jgi:hypothetical protein
MPFHGGGRRRREHARPRGGDVRLQFRSLRQDEASALGRIAQGQSFASMCEGLVPFAGELQAPARAAALLQAWVSSGWIVAIQT